MQNPSNIQHFNNPGRVYQVQAKSEAIQPHSTRNSDTVIQDKTRRNPSKDSDRTEENEPDLRLEKQTERPKLQYFNHPESQAELAAV